MKTVRRRNYGDCGAATVEAAVLMPVVIMLTLLAIQIALWQHARTSVMTAAQAGGMEAASVGGTPETGQARAEAFLTRVEGGMLHDTRVEVTATDETVTVVTTGGVMSLFPGWEPRVHATVQVPVERLTW